MRSPARITALVCAVAIVALALAGLTNRTSLAFTLGVAPGLTAVELAPDQEACQLPITVPPGGEFDRVVLKAGTYGRPGPELGVTVREQDTQRELATGTLKGGYGDDREHTVRVGEVPAGRKFALCVRNAGSAKVALYGNPDAGSRTSSLFLGGNTTGTDLTLVFERSPRSLLSLASAMFDRAALFKLSWIGGWAFWTLALLVLVAVPVLLVRAVRGLEE